MQRNRIKAILKDCNKKSNVHCLCLSFSLFNTITINALIGKRFSYLCKKCYVCRVAENILHFNILMDLL